MKRAIVFALILMCAHVCLATTIHVPADQPTIQAGIDAAVNGDTVLVAEGRYYQRVNFMGKRITVGSEFLIDGDTTHIANTIIDGSSTGYPDTDTGSVVRFVNGEDTSSVLCGLSIINGRGTVCWGGIVTAGAGILCRGSSALIANCWLSANWAMAGGGIFADGAAGTVVRSSVFKDNLSDFGGAIQGGPLRLEKCVFAGNRALRGGALCIGTCVIADCEFTSNNSSSGTAIYASGGADTILIERCVFSYNHATSSSGGGTIHTSTRTRCDVRNCTFYSDSGDYATTFLSSGEIEVRHSIIASCAGGPPVVQEYSGAAPTISIFCTNIFGNQNGNWVGLIAGLADSNGNISANPLFCDTASSDFHLQGNSPCAPGNNSCGVLIGALPVACGWNCGDIDGSGTVSITDAVRLIFYLFASGPEPLDSSGGDVNQDGRLNVADVVYLINYIFVGGPAPCAGGLK